MQSKGTDNNRIIVAPSILAADFGNLAAEIQSVASAGADWLHVDVMDGSFVPPITFGANVVALAKRLCALPLDVHLMIREPERHIDAFQSAGASRLTVHQEACPHLHRVLGEIQRSGMSAGVCINPGTPVQSVFDVLEVCDLVLVMTVNPGWGGQQFIPESLSKIATLREEVSRRKLTTWIEVDGGINAETAAACRKAGANAFVAGTFIFEESNRGAAISGLRGKT